jgi:protein-S-isoprenylcysteine O-methyltransferase Ste14
VTLIALTWPEAVVGATAVAMLGLILVVATWQIFRTGQTAIRNESRETHELVKSLRAEIDELRGQLGRSAPG